MATDTTRVKEIRDLETAMKDFYDAQRVVWDRNVLKHKGHHWLELSKANNAKIWQSSIPRYKAVDISYPTPVTNFIFEKVETIKSNVEKSFPLPSVTNRVNSDKARRSARFQDIACKHYEDILHMRLRIGDMAQWCLLTGGCLAVPYWNTNTGKYIEDIQKEKHMVDEPIKMNLCADCNSENPVDAPMCQSCGSPNMIPMSKPNMVQREFPVIGNDGQVVKEQVVVGDVNLKIASYYEFLFEPFHHELEDLGWIMRRRSVTTDWIKKRFNEDVPPDSAGAKEYLNVERLNTWQSFNIQLFREQDTGYFTRFLTDCVPLLEFYRRPDGTKDKGEYWALIGDKVITKDNFPYEDGKWHMPHVRFAKSPATFCGASLADVIIPINDQVNKIDQHIVWNRQTLIDPIIINPKGAGIENSSFYGRLGRILNVNDEAADKVRIMDGKGLDVRVYEERKIRVEDLDRLSVTDIFSGQAADSRTPGNVYEMRLEQATLKLADFGINLAEGVREIYKEFMWLLREKATTELKFAIIGEEEESEIEAFEGKDLAGDDQYDDGGVSIWVDFDSIYPKSKAALKQTTTEALQYGALNAQDPFDRALIHRNLGLDQKWLGNNFDVDQTAARREIARMDAGENITLQYAIQYHGLQKEQATPEVMGELMKKSPQLGLLPGENFAIHAEIHRQYIQKERFSKLKPNIQQIHLVHFLFTTAYMEMQKQQQLLQQAEMAMVQKGSPAPQKMGGI